MPEITSVRAIQDKLREFDARMDGAIESVNTLVRIRGDAEKINTKLQGFEKKCEKSESKIERTLAKAEDVRLQLSQLHDDWEKLKQQMNKTQGDTRALEDALLAKLDSAIQTLAKNLTQAEKRLQEVNKIILAEQADLLRELDASTKANADVAEKAVDFIGETSARLDSLLATLRDDLQTDVQNDLKKTNNWLSSELQRIEKHLEDKGKDYQRLLREEMSAFKAELQRDLANQEQAIDRRLTDFLNKQNAMVQNLSQQIDSFQRLSQSLSSGLGVTNTKLSELAESFFTQKETTRNELQKLAGGLAELKQLLIKIETKLSSQDSELAKLNLVEKDTAKRLDQMLDTLRRNFFTGKSFK